jgi:hypothetical protein
VGQSDRIHFYNLFAGHGRVPESALAVAKALLLAIFLNVLRMVIAVFLLIALQRALAPPLFHSCLLLGASAGGA